VGREGEVQLVAGIAVGSLILHQRSCSTSIEEVDGDTTLAAGVGGGELAVEVLEEVDLFSVIRARGEDAWDGVHSASGVVADDGGVDELVEEQLLVCFGVATEECLRVLVAERLGCCGCADDG